MRRLAASAFVFAFLLTLAGATLMAAGPAPAARQGQTGTVNGVAQSSQGQTLANYTVRIRNLANGNLAGTTTSSTAGQFSFAGLNPGNYAIEIVNAAGQIVGTSASIAVAAGATVAVTVSAAAVAAIAAAGGAAAGGISTALIVTTVAAAAGIAGIVVAVNRSNASPSR